uniref:Retrovirus-related Pol polyprotein from transposon TNT 1-94 n=1 Tax=Cajanus cajan TaxID=3821 RepID=A0A151SLD9_CAJCA|nr:hypothetical protein KK1_001810 [Cajanus cajan]
MENRSNPPLLSKNSIVAQIRRHNNKVAKEGRALVIIQATLHDVFMKILTLETTKETWVKLQEKF